MTFLIYIEGNIGSGKSTFAKNLETKYLKNFLKQNLDAKIIQEPVEEWVKTFDSDGKNILEKFYENIDRWSFTFQMNSFISRIKKIQDELELEPTDVSGFDKEYPMRKALFVERSVFTDKNVFAKNCFESNKMTKMEYDIYCNWNKWLSDKFELAPSAYIYLRCDPKINNERIIKRARNEEESIPIEYLTQIHNKHEDWMYNEMKKDVPVLTIDATEDFTKEEKMEELYKKVYNFIQSLK